MQSSNPEPIVISHENPLRVTILNIINIKTFYVRN
jgi:hypothetical protein